MPRFACRLIYDGTNYFGYQKQVADQPTVQGTVEDVLSRMAKAPITVYGAGRTDSGVHATGQVIAFDMKWQHPTATLMKAVNASLPPDIALGSILKTDDDFHPRFNAKRRSYLYRLHITPNRDPMRRLNVWSWQQDLDLAAMQSCLPHLIGNQDFATFGTPPTGTNTVRQVFVAELRPVEDELHFFIEGNAFLKRMVRSIVGTLVDVGRGKMSMEAFESALKSAERSQAGPSAPPQGLTLMRVFYESDIDQLFERE